jgi:hypothetical protein
MRNGTYPSRVAVGKERHLPFPGAVGKERHLAAAVAELQFRRDSTQAASQEAELVVLGVEQDVPLLFAGLPDIGRARTDL